MRCETGGRGRRSRVAAIGLLAGTGMLACGSGGLGQCVEARIVLDPIKSFVQYRELGEMTRSACLDLCASEGRECDWRRNESVTGP